MRGNVSTNRLENYFSQLKRSIDGTHHHVSREHLPRYLAEFDFRYSTCDMTDSQRMGLLVDRSEGRRLTYKHTTGSYSASLVNPHSSKALIDGAWIHS